MQGAKWRPMLSFRHLANICRSTYLLDTLFTKFWKNHIKLLHKFIGEMWKQQQHATTTYEIHFSSCFFFDLSYRPISRQNPEPRNLSPLVRQALLNNHHKQRLVKIWNMRLVGKKLRCFKTILSVWSLYWNLEFKTFVSLTIMYKETKIISPIQSTYLFW